ncbi:MAG: acyl--CoA ligase [Burkholderiales bacterium]|nr:acyl--CoA ligase [Burkholderiales bacterium]
MTQCRVIAMSFLPTLHATVARQPDATAIFYRNERISYADLQARWLSAADYLRAKGVREGMRVGITLTQSPDYCVFALALAQLGAVTLNLSPALAAAERRDLCERFAVDLLVSCWPGLEDAGLPCIALTEQIHSRVGAISPTAFPPPAAQAPFRILLTSGTTDAPAGVVQTYEAASLRMTRMSAPFEADTCLLASDLNIASSLIPVLGTLCAGGRVVFATEYSAEDVVNVMERFAVTRLMMVPVQAAGLAHYLAGRQQTLPALKHVCLVGATPAPPVTDLLRAKLTPNVHVVYGVTEIGVIALATAAELVGKPACVGRVAPWARIEVVDGAGAPLPPNEVGTVRVAVDGMIADYVGEPQARTSRFEGGWFYPGDLGWIDAAGYLFIDGRQDDVLNVGGNKVRPEAVESVLRGFPGVTDVAVFVDRTVRGDSQLVAAYVSPEIIDVKDIGPYALERLGWLAPQCYMRVDELPRTESGKLQRRKLHGSLIKHGV